MTKRLWIIAAAVIFVVLAGVFFSSFIYKETFESGAEGVFLSAEYTEKYRIVTVNVDVNKTKYKHLLIRHDIDLDAGSVTFELFDPNQKLIDSGEVTKEQTYSKITEASPTKGKWVVKYYTNEQTNGNYHLSMKSS